jgi:hypothetical protein
MLNQVFSVVKKIYFYISGFFRIFICNLTPVLSSNPDNPMEDSINQIKKLLPELSRQLFKKPNVVATGIGYKRVGGIQTDELAIICSVETKVPLTSLTEIQQIPPEIEGIPTDVQQTGSIHVMIILPDQAGSLPEPGPHTERHRPYPGGVSIGHNQITAGTLGCMVKKEGKIFILSNNHVLANSNNASPGDAIIQPGVYDGGNVEQDVVAGLYEFIPVSFENDGEKHKIPKGLKWVTWFLSRLVRGNTNRYTHTTQPVYNLVDCAIAGPVPPADCLNEIMKVGKIKGIAEGSLGTRIKKSGRTTGITSGSIEQVEVTVRVNFGGGRTAFFSDQYIAGAMSKGGDSGSVILDRENRAIGLLFAGSPNSTIINRIENVFSLLDITLL